MARFDPISTQKEGKYRKAAMCISLPLLRSVIRYTRGQQSLDFPTSLVERTIQLVSLGKHNTYEHKLTRAAAGYFFVCLFAFKIWP